MHTRKLIETVNTAFRLAQLNSTAQYRGSILGIIWLLSTPILTLFAYVMAFSFIFSGRWEDAGYGSVIEFTIFLYSGLLIFNSLAEVLNRSSSLYSENINFIKKTVFPLYLLNGSLVIQASVGLAINCILLTILFYLSHAYVPVTILGLPLLIVSYIIFLYGVSLIVSTLCLLVKDIRHSIGFLCHIGLFISPIFYNLSDVPDKIRYLLLFNPVTYYIGVIRDALYIQEFNLGPIIASYLISATVLMIGWYFHTFMRSVFSEAL